MASSSRLPSARLSEIYHQLGPSEQAAFLEKHIFPLIDTIPADRASAVLGAASAARNRLASVPALNLKAKKSELYELQLALDRDAKRGCVQGHSNRDELLREIGRSLTDWLGDIWRVVYEGKTHFGTAHSSLMLCAHVLESLESTRGGCKCAFMSLYIPVPIKRRSGKVVKEFALDGGHNIEQAMFWIWRDMFLTMLAARSHGQSQADLVLEMLGEIEEVLGWRATERILYGGKHSYRDGPDDDDALENWEDVDTGSVLSDTSESACGDNDCTCVYHAAHWSAALQDQVIPLRRLVHTHLVQSFSRMPTERLYQTILTLSDAPRKTEATLQGILRPLAAASPDALCTALYLNALSDDTPELVRLLDESAHLLRPHDAPALQAAALALGRASGTRARARALLEEELLAAARAAHVALLGCFTHLDGETPRAELAALLRLRSGTNARAARIEAWLDTVSAPALALPHGLAAAAALIGVPLPGADTADMDAAGVLDVDPDDPDLEDLRHELRPRIKDRLEGWVDAAASISGGADVLVDVYKVVIELMPCLRGTDVTDEMIARLSDKPSKHHVCDFLDALSTFVKSQRRKAQVKNEKRRAATEALANAAPAPPTFEPGGVNDVD